MTTPRAEDCACAFVPEYDPCTILQQCIRVARKSRTCDDCRRAIVPGECYEYAFYVEPGRTFAPMQTHTCATCLEIRDTFFCKGYVFAGSMELFAEYLTDCIDNLPWPSIAKLSPSTRALVCDMIESEWGEE